MKPQTTPVTLLCDNGQVTLWSFSVRKTKRKQQASFSFLPAQHPNMKWGTRSNTGKTKGRLPMSALRGMRKKWLAWPSSRNGHLGLESLCLMATLSGDHEA